jgi:hypothetical protein
VDLGFDPTDVLTFRMSLDRDADSPSAASFYRDLLAQLRNLPGVTSAAASTAHPLSRAATGFTRPYRRIDERTASAAAEKTQMSMVTPDFFATLDIPILAGSSPASCGCRAPLHRRSFRVHTRHRAGRVDPVTALRAD